MTTPGATAAVTLPEYFMKNGYRVAGGGKIFHSKQTDYRCFHEYYKDEEEDDDDAPVSKKQLSAFNSYLSAARPFQRGSQVERFDEPMQIVGMQAQQPGRSFMLVIGLIECLQHYLALGCVERLVVQGG